MKLSFSTLGCPDWSWNNIIATAKDMGFDGIEIRGVENEIYAPAISVFNYKNIENVKSRLDSLNLKIICLTTACYLFDKERSRTVISEGKEYIDLAYALNVPYIRVLGDEAPQPGNDIDDSFVAQQLRILSDYASNKNVTVLIETNGVFADSNRLLKLIETVNRDNVRVLWDVHHTFRFFGETPAYTYNLLGKYICYLHVKDSVVNNEGKITYKMMGYGDLPLVDTIRILKENGYDGYVSLEWVKRWYSDLEEPGVVFMQYISYMKRKLRSI